MSDLQVRVCVLTQIVSGNGEAHTLGVITEHAEGADAQARLDAIEELAAKIATLEFSGTSIRDSSGLRDAVNKAKNAGFPDADLLVIGPADGLSGERSRTALERAAAVKQFLVDLGVPAENLAADTPLTAAVEA